MVGHRFHSGFALALATVLGALPATSRAAEPLRPRVCVVSVSLPEGSSDKATAQLVQALEQALERNRDVELVKHERFVQVATERQLSAEQWSSAENLNQLGSALELNAVVLAWVSRHGKKFRLLVGAVDPLDGGQMATASTVLPAPRVDKKNARAVTTTLVRDLRAWIAADLATPPPPPGAAAPVEATTPPPPPPPPVVP
ncbi:MAG: hypothetical protein ABIJ09_08010 [Pseudomonadota bacterium]